jgi:hypothetical protein
MDLPAPVANTIKPPDPMASLNMMGGMLDLQKSRQALQIGAEHLAQQKVETNKQQQLQQFFKEWDPSQHIAADGTTDLESVFNDPSFKKLDIAKPAAIEALQGIKTKQYQNKAQLASLDANTLQRLTQQTGALLNDDDVAKDGPAGRAKVSNLWASFGAESPENQRIASLYGPMVQHAPQGKLKDALGAFQLQGADVLGQRGQQNPQPMNLPNGQLGFRTPGSTDVTMPGQSASGGAPKPAGWNVPAPQLAAQTAGLTGGVDQDNQRVDLLSKGTANAREAVTLTDEIKQLASMARTGTWSGVWADKFSALAPADKELAARQIIKKDSERLAQVVGSTGRDSAERETITNALPNPDKMSNEAMIQAADYVGGHQRLFLARSKAINNYVDSRQGSGNPMAGARYKDDMIASNADPLMFSYRALDKASQVEFLRNHFGDDKQKMREFVSRLLAFEHTHPGLTNGK